MWRRKLRLLLWSLIVAQIAFVVLALWPRSPLFTEKSCERIRTGMTYSEVEAIVGVPAGDYRFAHDPESHSEFIRLQTLLRPFGKTVERWESDDVYLVVTFDTNRQVESKMHHGHPGASTAEALNGGWSRVVHLWHRIFS
jgi:hypothetical protein